LDAREVLTRQRLRDAAASDVTFRDIPIHVKASLQGVDAVKVAVTIEAANLPLEVKAGRHEGTVDLMVVCGDLNRQVVCYLNQQMRLSMSADRYEQAMSSGIPYEAVVPVKGVVSFVKVLVYDYDADLIGSTYVRLR
jgi:hypothetical protein